MRRTLTVARRTVGELTSLKFLLLFLAPYTVVTVLLASGATNGLESSFASRPLATQTQYLRQTVTLLIFVWALGIPVMLLVAVLAANALAKEAETGTLRILLSKPVRRIEVLAGKLLAIVLVTYLLAVTGLFLLLAAVTLFANVAPTALSAGLVALVPVALVYALVLTLALSGLGTVAAVLTKSRLQTALVTAAVALLFFAFLLVRSIVGREGAYEDFFLYAVDVNYHLGNVYVFLAETLGLRFTPETQAGLGLVTGVYDATGWGRDPLVGGLSGSVPVVGYVPMVASLALVVLFGVACLGVSVYRFQRQDIS